MNSECVLSNFKLTQVSRGQRYDNIAGFLMEFKGTYQQLINIAEKINNTVFAASQIRAHWQEHQAEDEEHHRPDYEARERWWRKWQALGDGWSRGFGRRSRPRLVNGRDPRLSVGGIAPTGAYRSEVPWPQAPKNDCLLQSQKKSKGPKSPTQRSGVLNYPCFYKIKVSKTGL